MYTLPVSLASLAFLVAALAQPPAAAPPPFVGRWVFTITQADGVELAVRMTVESRAGGRWEAYSRPGAAREMVSWHTALVGRVLGKLPPRGALVRVDSATTRDDGDSTVVEGVLDTPFFGRQHFAGTVRGERLHAELRRGGAAGRVAGSIDAVPDHTDAPLRDYRALGAELRDTIASTVYDPQLAESRAWRGFFDELDRRLARARDDADAVLAFYALRPRLGSSHFEFIRNPRLAATPIDSIIAGDLSVDPQSLVRLTFPAPGIAYLRVDKWERVGPAVDGAFARIDSARSTTLVLDIRGNPGGDATSMWPVAHLVADTLRVGTFLTRGWYATHRALPTAAQVAALPPLFPEGNGAALVYAIRERATVVGAVAPKAPHFGGAVYLLVDGGTGSASEPLAWALRSTGRATLVGTRTAGAMLTALPHPVGGEWVVVVPEADFVSAAGARLEGHGVAPHVKATSAEAVVVAADRIARSAPYAGTLLRAASYAGARRWAEAERAYRDAARIGPDSLGPVSGLANVYAQQQRWDEVFALWETRLRAHPGEFTARYQLGRVAALSGQKLGRGETVLRSLLADSASLSVAQRGAAHKRLAAVLDARGDRSGARAQYEEALRLNPRDTEAASALQALGSPRP